MKYSKQFIMAQSIKEELYILEAFINQQILQISEYVSSIDSRVNLNVSPEYLHTSANDGVVVDCEQAYIEGISDADYDIKGLFTKTMAVYQRQALLVTLWSRLEAKLDFFVTYLAISKNLKRKFKQNGVSDFKHLINELERYGIKLSDKAEVLSAIDFLDLEVRFIRNSWVHNGGRPCKESIRTVVESSSGLIFIDGLISVEHSYLEHVLMNMKILADKIFEEAS